MSYLWIIRKRDYHYDFYVEMTFTEAIKFVNDLLFPHRIEPRKDYEEDPVWIME